MSTLKRETNVNWGRAVAGWALFGVVGGAVGAVTGEDRNVNVCLDCGTSWKAADLHKLLQTIKKLTNLELKLSEEVNRIFINNFISEFSSDLEAIVNIEKQGQKTIKEIQNKSNENAGYGCSYGCAASIGLAIVSSGIAASAGAIIGFIMLLLPIVGLIFGAQLDTEKKKLIEQQIEKINREIEIKKLDAEKKLKAKVVNFMNRHPVVDQDE